uniref:Uncharacterized protein n=1 Tax=Brassica oleracea TaxID=3712 RepID=A0A3P6BSQ0_BRAOL|nr:unnamed protein product [Brassica oleracea]
MFYPRAGSVATKKPPMPGFRCAPLGCISSASPPPPSSPPSEAAPPLLHDDDGDCSSLSSVQAFSRPTTLQVPPAGFSLSRRSAGTTRPSGCSRCRYSSSLPKHLLQLLSSSYDPNSRSGFPKFEA